MAATPEPRKPWSRRRALPGSAAAARSRRSRASRIGPAAATHAWNSRGVAAQVGIESKI